MAEKGANISPSEVQDGQPVASPADILQKLKTLALQDTRTFLEGLPELSKEAERLQKYRQIREADCLSDYQNCQMIVEHCTDLIKTLRAHVAVQDSISLADHQAVRLVDGIKRAMISSIDQKRREDTDYFFAAHAHELQEFRRLVKEDQLIPLPYVLEKKKEIEKDLEQGRAVLLHGETGSGKTEVARDAARAFSGKEARLIRCHGFMGEEELFGHQSLTSSDILRGIELVKAVDKEIAELEAARPNMEREDRERAIDLIMGKAKSSGVTISQYVLGSIYLAAQEGRVVILDEFNAMPQDLRLALNDILTRRSGRLLSVQENGKDPIVVQDGFGIIATANINSEHSKKYVGIEELSLAQLNRFHSIEYGYLPQKMSGALVEAADLSEKQLFAMTLIPLLNDRLEFVTPPGGLEKLWNVAQYARLSQVAFSGGIGSASPYALHDNGSPVTFESKVCLSPRLLADIVRFWKNDNFEFELDHYIFQHFVSSSLSNMERKYLYNLAVKQGLFRPDGNWPSEFSKIADEDEVPFEVASPHRREEQLALVARDQVLEALFGDAPERTYHPTEEEVEDVEARTAAATDMEIAQVSDELAALMKAHDR